MSSHHTTEPKDLDSPEADNIVDLTGRRFSAKDHFAPIKNLAKFKEAVDEDDDEGGGEDGETGIGRLVPTEQSEYEQRIIRRAGEAQYGEHVKDPRHPTDLDLEDELGMGMGMGSGVQSHPLLADMPLGADSLSPLERMEAAQSDATRLELKRKLVNQKSAAYTSSPTYTR